MWLFAMCTYFFTYLCIMCTIMYFVGNHFLWLATCVFIMAVHAQAVDTRLFFFSLMTWNEASNITWVRDCNSKVIWYPSTTSGIIGVSLSKPHTSGTALQGMCVYDRLYGHTYTKNSNGYEGTDAFQICTRAKALQNLQVDTMDP